jgi:hypothetical protein
MPRRIVGAGFWTKVGHSQRWDWIAVLGEVLKSELDFSADVDAGQSQGLAIGKLPNRDDVAAPLEEIIVSVLFGMCRLCMEVSTVWRTSR